METMTVTGSPLWVPSRSEDSSMRVMARKASWLRWAVLRVSRRVCAPEGCCAVSSSASGSVCSAEGLAPGKFCAVPVPASVPGGSAGAFPAAVSAGSLLLGFWSGPVVPGAASLAARASQQARASGVR
ncbi:hypothetical protein FIV07_11585 [Mycobacterium sp. THAF192]|nr:hypothetical protein FIV07_11585 [Mycobacterium sp. THAF192]